MVLEEVLGILQAPICSIHIGLLPNSGKGCFPDREKMAHQWPRVTQQENNTGKL
jgi:hypothetical protein